MATTNDIYAEMQRYAPLELAESWDNPGLLVDCGREVSRVLVTLDITPEVVEEAAAGGCELIVSHHPVIFSPLKKLTPRDVSFQLVQKGISAICMHTNLDAAEGGVNEVLAPVLSRGRKDLEVLLRAATGGAVSAAAHVTIKTIAACALPVSAGGIFCVNFMMGALGWIGQNVAGPGRQGGFCAWPGRPAASGKTRTLDLVEQNQGLARAREFAL